MWLKRRSRTLKLRLASATGFWLISICLRQTSFVVFVASSNLQNQTIIFMKIGVTGITGRMGRTIASLVLQDTFVELSSALVRAGGGLEGSDLGEFLGFEKSGAKMTSSIDQFIQSCDAIIDFSSPSLSLEIAAKCAENKKILICGTTGFSESEKQKFAANASSTVIVWSSKLPAFCTTSPTLKL